MSTARVFGSDAAAPAPRGLTVEPVARSTALPPAALVLLGGVLAALAPALGVVHSYDGSPVQAWVAAGWVAVLPGVLALALVGWRPAAGLAAAAGAGVVGGALFVMDLPVVLDPDTIARPELFVETTARALPFRAAGGGYLLLVADLVMLAGGVVAAVALSRSVTPADSGPASVSSQVVPGRPSQIESGQIESGRIVSSQMVSGPIGPDRATDFDDLSPDLLAGADDGTLVVLPTRTRRRNNLMLVVGFTGVLLLLAGTLPTAYTGGYLLERFVPVGGDVVSTLGVALLAGVGAVAVLCAVQLPRLLAVALLSGTALAAAIPALRAVIVVLAGAPVALGGAVWFALTGAALLAAAGTLSQVRLVTVRSDDWAPRRGARVVVGVVGLVAAALAATAALVPLLHVDGHAEVAEAGALTQDAALRILFVGAAVLLAIGGVLTLIPATAVVGRPVLMVAVGGVAFALARSMDTLTVLVAGTRQTAALGMVTPRTWSAGPGLWAGFGALLVAAAAAVLARLDDRRAADDALDIADDDALADSRRRRGVLASVVAVLALVVLCLPTYRTVLGPAPTLFGGFALDTWGVWALFAVSIGALGYAVLDSRPAVAGAFPVAAAAVIGLRLLVPSAVRSDADFHTAGGTLWTWVLIGVLVGTAVAMVLLVRPVPRTAAPPLPLDPAPSAGGTSSTRPKPTSRARPARGGKRR